MRKIQVIFSPRAPRTEKSVNNRRKKGYTVTVQNICGALPPPEEHHETIKDIQTTVQGIQAQSYELEGLAQANAVITSSNSAVMSQLAHMTVTMNSIQVQLKKLASATTNQARVKKKHCFLSCGINFTHRRKTCSSKKSGHQYYAYYKKRVVGCEKGCE